MVQPKIPSLEEIVAGNAAFKLHMRVWEAKFCDDSWLFIDATSPLYQGPNSSSIVWGDYIYGRGSTFAHPNSVHRNSYPYCLTSEIVADLKVAAVIYGYYPALLKGARVAGKAVDPVTVKERIENLARIFSAAILAARARGVTIRRLQEISFSLLKEVIAKHPGRGDALKRALKLISAPIIQNNLSGPLQWQLLDVEKTAIAWSNSPDRGGIDTLPDVFFLAIQDYCLAAIRDFKTVLGLPILCQESSPFSQEMSEDLRGSWAAIEALLKEAPVGDEACDQFAQRFGITVRAAEGMVTDAQCAAIMLMLLYTGMRRSELQYVLNGSLRYKDGYWFINSKVVKQKKKDMPISEGWLAIDAVRDAYEILSYFCGISNNTYLISSPFSRFGQAHRGYALDSLNKKLSRWLKFIDVHADYSDWKFSIHQCRETLVAQLANQQVKLPFISMQLKHFHSRFHSMPNSVTAGYGKYREQLMTSVATRLPQAREFMMNDLYGENARFAGGGAQKHKVRIDAFFAGMGLFGQDRVEYIKQLARRSSRFQPTSIGGCVRNFDLPVLDEAPPCYGDFECDPDCGSHVITERGGLALKARREHALAKAHNETNPQFKVIWMGLADKLGRHVNKLERGATHV